MSSVLPGTELFSTPVYGTVFARRTEAVHRLRPGDRLILVPDPPGAEPQTVWVHARGGDVVGHLSPDVSAWLAPWMLSGLCYGAEVEIVAHEGARRAGVEMDGLSVQAHHRDLAAHLVRVGELLHEEELVARRHDHRSPLVLRGVDDYLSGTRWPLDFVKEVAVQRGFWEDTEA